jgi:hypothetical protein
MYNTQQLYLCTVWRHPKLSCAAALNLVVFACSSWAVDVEVSRALPVWRHRPALPFTRVQVKFYDFTLGALQVAANVVGGGVGAVERLAAIRADKHLLGAAAAITQGICRQKIALQL